jgi:hypothetical protein
VSDFVNYPARSKMRRILTIALLLLFADGCRCGFTHAAQQAPRINCKAAHQRELDLAPLGNGPLQLQAIYCQSIRSTPFTKSGPILSPDGQSIAYVEHDTILRVARLDGGDTWTDYRTEMGSFAHFGSIRSAPAVSWASNSKSVWSAHHEAIQPSGFAKSPLQPLKTSEDGGILPLPLLQHDAGPLDALLWADGEGLAVAQFGTRGGYYQPEHADKKPSFAIVDAQRGLVLDTLAFTAIEALKDRAPSPSPNAVVRDAAAARLVDGKVRVLLSVGRWVLWTEGHPPVTMADPYAADFGNRIVMSPDGSHVLVGRQLRTAGAMICERKPDCSAAGHPVEGILAAMHDLDNGRLIWSIRATVTADYEFPAPAISPDARFALIGLVPEGTRPLIALVALEDGRIVQTIPSPGGNYAMGFARAGLSVWTHSHGLTAVYDVQAAPQ